jgi:hypothetical protein
MTQNNNEIIREKTEMVTEGQEHKEGGNGRFLPIFFWTD